MNVNISIRKEPYIHPQWTRTFIVARISEPYWKRLVLALRLVMVIVGLVFNVCGDFVDVIVCDDFEEVEE